MIGRRKPRKIRSQNETSYETDLAKNKHEETEPINGEVVFDSNSNRTQDIDIGDAYRHNTDFDNIEEYREDNGTNNVDRNVRTLKKRLEYLISTPTSYCSLVGVFGMNSDSVVNRALATVKDNVYVESLGKTFYTGGEDIYTLIAAQIFNCINELSKSTYYYSRRQDDLREILPYLSKIYYSSSNSYYEDDPLTTLSTLADRQSRDIILGEAITKLVKGLGHSSTFKYILNVEVSMGCMSYDLLNSIEKIYSCSNNLLIIVNSLTSMEINARLVSSSIGDIYPNDGVFYRFFRSDNLFSC